MKPLLTCGSPKINVRNLTDVTFAYVTLVAMDDTVIILFGGQIDTHERLLD